MSLYVAIRVKKFIKLTSVLDHAFQSLYQLEHLVNQALAKDTVLVVALAVKADVAV